MLQDFYVFLLIYLYKNEYNEFKFRHSMKTKKPAAEQMTAAPRLQKFET